VQLLALDLPVYLYLNIFSMLPGERLQRQQGQVTVHLLLLAAPL
jgi:hypothetical protein